MPNQQQVTSKGIEMSDEVPTQETVFTEGSESTPTVSHAVTTEVNLGGSTDEPSSDTVRLVMAYVDDTFHYGDGDDEVITGRKPKEFSKVEGERVLDLAIKSGAHVLAKGDDN